MIPINDKNEKTPAEQKDQEAPKQETVKTDEPETKEESTVEEKAETAQPEEKAQGTEEASQEEKVDPLKDELAQMTDKYLRICAEYDNFRRRSQKEKENLYGDIRANVITSFLPVYDNLVRALAAETQDEAYRKGVEMIMNQFNTTLEKLGATEIKAVGEKFDPSLHNAVMHVEDENKGENEIVEEFQKGFKIGDKVIRFSMVKVAN
ncbi:MAG: nucleotide exchange factor GrpE [Oscillospiraceae bacterium]|nr:nucleotide exchange factor GrpE [Oscillospiraceae bacterium]